MSQKALLTIDAILNLLLGLLLGFFPRKVMAVVGLPLTENPFYASILGGVLFGIGVALLLDLSHEKTKLRGLGLGGAIAINLCGGGVLALWLLIGDLDVPSRGRIIMWSLVVALLMISAAELAAWRRARSKR